MPKKKRKLQEMSLDELKNAMDSLTKERDVDPYRFTWKKTLKLRKISREYYRRISQSDKQPKIVQGGAVEMGRRGGQRRRR